MPTVRKNGLITIGIALLVAVIAFYFGVVAEADRVDTLSEIDTLAVPEAIAYQPIAETDELNYYEDRVRELADNYLDGSLLRSGFEENEEQITFWDTVFFLTGADPANEFITVDRFIESRDVLRYDTNGVQLSVNEDGSTNVAVDIDVELQQFVRANPDGSPVLEYTDATLSPDMIIVTLDSNGEWIGGALQ